VKICAVEKLTLNFKITLSFGENLYNPCEVMSSKR